MSFVNPQAFFLLLTIPLILLFHLFRAERREVRVTTLRFWDPVSREREASGTYLRMPRLDLLLLLQVLAVLLITLALARPTVTSVVHGWPRIVLIIDTSASMKATDVPGGRFAAARDEAMAVVAGLKPHQQAMLLEASSRPAVLVPFTGDREVLTSALEALQPTDGPASLDQAIETASELVKDGLPAEIRLFTDASFPGIAPPKAGSPPLKWHTVGRRTENVGITTLEVRRTPSAGSDYQVYVAVSNFSPERKNFSFSLMLDGALLYEQQVSLPGEVTRSFVVPFTDEAGGVIRAEIDPHDDLMVDDVAYAVLPEPFPLKVLLVTRGNLFLEEALRAEAVVELETIIPELFVAGADGADVVVLDDMSLDSLPPGRYLLIRTLSGDAPLQHLGSVEFPPIIDWDRDHPVMRYVDLSKVVIQQAMKVRPVGGGKPLAESNETPLIYAWDEGSVRAIFVGFDLYQSDIPIRVAFPLFVNNALRWLYPGRL